MQALEAMAAKLFEYSRTHPIAPSIDSNVGRTALHRKLVHIPDVLADHDYRATGYQRIGNYRAMVGVPVMRDGNVLLGGLATAADVRSATASRSLARTY
jgi:two-component system NtrC family sensor kinase